MKTAPRKSDMGIYATEKQSKSDFSSGNPSHGSHHLVVEAILPVLDTKKPVNFRFDCVDRHVLIFALEKTERRRSGKQTSPL
jgi:hypothetical protein